MRSKKTLWGLLTGLLLASAAAAADRYEIDPVHTEVGFSVKHLVINNVRGKFNDFSGTILYDENDITKSSVQVSIKAASIDTGVKDRDNDLRSPNFFDVAKYPKLTFQSRSIEKRGDGYVAVGTLTMHGIAKEIALPFTLNGKIKDPWGSERVGFEAGLTINRQDWGINYSKVMDNGGLMVGNDVKIELNVEAVKK
jgi:polyisoprenoid-binding protein YceI